MKKTDDKDIHNLNKCIGELTIPTCSLEKLEKSIQKIKKLCNEPLNLAIVGEFNAGKSSFINVLLGLDGLLPTSILPKTATLTKLKYGEVFGIEIVKIENGNKIIEKSDDLEILKKYQNAKDVDSDDFKNNIKEIVITLKNDILKNFTFIDTPGFNHDEKMSNLTRSIYPEVDIFIWMMTKDQVIKQTEKEELEKLENLKKDVFFLVNKSDKNEAEIEISIEEYIKEQIPESFKKSPIYFISSKLDYVGKYKNNFDEFRIDLREKALNKDIKITINLLKNEFLKLKNEIKNEIDIHKNVKKDLNTLKIKLMMIRGFKGLDFETFEIRTNCIKELMVDANKIVKKHANKYKKANNFLRKYILEKEFNEKISKQITDYFSLSIDKITNSSKEIKEFIEKKDIKVFEESQLIKEFINSSLFHIKKNLDPLGTKGMIYNLLMSNNYELSPMILEDLYIIDETIAFKITIYYLDELLLNLEKRLDLNIVSLEDLINQVNKFEWSKDAL